MKEHPFSLTGSPIQFNLMHVLLDCGRKPVHLENTHTNAGRTCKLLTQDGTQNIATNRRMCLILTVKLSR